MVEHLADRLADRMQFATAAGLLRGIGPHVPHGADVRVAELPPMALAVSAR
jgi:hypothetical protein